METFKKYFIDHSDAWKHWIYLLILLGLITGQIHVSVSIGSNSY